MSVVACSDSWKTANLQFVQKWFKYVWCNAILTYHKYSYSIPGYFVCDSKWRKEMGSLCSLPWVITTINHNSDTQENRQNSDPTFEKVRVKVLFWLMLSKHNFVWSWADLKIKRWMYNIIICTIFITTGNLCWWFLVWIKNAFLLGYTLSSDLKVMYARFWEFALHRKLIFLLSGYQRTCSVYSSCHHLLIHSLWASFLFEILCRLLTCDVHILKIRTESLLAGYNVGSICNELIYSSSMIYFTYPM